MACNRDIFAFTFLFLMFVVSTHLSSGEESTSEKVHCFQPSHKLLGKFAFGQNMMALVHKSLNTFLDLF
jgi:hypothetical protein